MVYEELEIPNYNNEIKEIYYYDSINNDWVTGDRWWGKAYSELINKVEINKPMLEKAEKMLELAGMVPAIQGKVDLLSNKVEKMKMISPDDYVECEKCGLLVNKNKAQIFSSVEEKRECSLYLYSILYGQQPQSEKEAVLHYLCQHCDMKKFKKENKY